MMMSCFHSIYFKSDKIIPSIYHLKATSTHRYDTGTSLQSTTLSLGSMSRTDSPPSTKSYRPQDISLPPSSDTMSLQAPIFLNVSIERESV